MDAPNAAPPPANADQSQVDQIWLTSTHLNRYCRAMAKARYNVQEAKTQLSDLLARAERGDEIIIARAGVPIVRLALIDGRPKRTFGVIEFVVPDDFDSPLSDDELGAWEQGAELVGEALPSLPGLATYIDAGE